MEAPTVKKIMLLVLAALFVPLQAMANGDTFTAAELKEISRMSRTDACRDRCELSDVELVRMEVPFLREGQRLYLAIRRSYGYCGNRWCDGAVLWQGKGMQGLEVLADAGFRTVTSLAMDHAERIAGRVLCIERGQCPVAEPADASVQRELRSERYATPHGVAVIIGNRTYRNERIPEVDYAHRDAEAFKRFVLEVLGFDPRQRHRPSRRHAVGDGGGVRQRA